MFIIDIQYYQHHYYWNVLQIVQNALKYIEVNWLQFSPLVPGLYNSYYLFDLKSTIPFILSIHSDK